MRFDVNVRGLKMIGENMSSRDFDWPEVVLRDLVLEWKLDVVAVAIAPLIVPIAGYQLVDRKQAAGK